MGFAHSLIHFCTTPSSGRQGPVDEHVREDGFDRGHDPSRRGLQPDHRDRVVSRSDKVRMHASVMRMRMCNACRMDEIPVIHCASGVLNPIKWARIENYVEVDCANRRCALQLLP